MKRVGILSKISTLALVAATSAIGLADPAFAQSQDGASQAPAAAEEPQPAGDDIVVTAQRREESLKTVPISIATLSGDKLDSSNKSVNDELALVPGVAVVSSINNGSQLTVRGVTGSAGVLTGSSPIGYYLDSVPFGFVRHAFAPDANSYDLERVEVLRGPQGTLYGAGSQGGVVRVLTKPANLNDFEAKARASVSNTDGGDLNYRGDAAVNVPLVEGAVAARAVIGYERIGGWIDRAGKENHNSGRNWNVRVKLNARASDNLNLELIGNHVRNKRNGNQIARANLTTIVAIDEPMDENYETYSFKADYDLGFATFTSATSYLDYRLHSLYNLVPTNPANIVVSDFDSKIFSEEINLSSNGTGPWKWSVGGIYRDVDDSFRQLAPEAFVNKKGSAYSDYSTSFAIFGEITRSLFNDRLKLTGGLRYFEDRVRNQPFSISSDAAAPLIPSKYKFSKISPRAVITWLPTSNFMAYASYSEGFRSGLSQSPSVKARFPNFGPVKSDNLINYEIGSKGDFLNGAFGYEVAVYHTKWAGIQQQLLTPFVGANGQTTNVSAVVNGGTASGLGFDIGLTMRPSRNFTVAMNYSWNDLTFEADVRSGTTVVFGKGDRITNSPKQTIGVLADYRIPLGEYTARLSGALNYVSEREVRGLVAGQSIVASSDDLVTARTSLALETPRGWSASLFVDNLTNNHGSPVPEAIASPGGKIRLRPRVIGLQLEGRF